MIRLENHAEEWKRLGAASRERKWKQTWLRHLAERPVHSDPEPKLSGITDADDQGAFLRGVMVAFLLEVIVGTFWYAVWQVLR